MHAAVVRSKFRSQNVQNTPCSEQFWKLRSPKGARCAKHISKSKWLKHLVSEQLRCRKVRAVAARRTCRSQKAKSRSGLEHFGSWDVKKVHSVVVLSACLSEHAKSATCSPLMWQAQWILHLAKSEQNVRVLQQLQKTMAGVGLLKRVWKETFCMAGTVQETCQCSSEMFGGRDRCSISHDLPSLFRDGHNTLDRWGGKIAKCTGTRPSALHSTFHFGKKSRRILSFAGVNSHVFRTSCRITAFWTCQIPLQRQIHTQIIR